MEELIDNLIETMPKAQKILDVGVGFWASKTLLTAVKLELFTQLGEDGLSAQEIKTKLGLNERGLYDFLDALVSLGFLKRKGLKREAFYFNTQDTSFYLDKTKPSYIGGFLEMANNRLFGYWNNLEEGLKTGRPQNEIKIGGRNYFNEIYTSKVKTEEFVNAMAGIQKENFTKFSKEFNFNNYNSLCDIGGSGGFLAIQVAFNNEHMECISFDLPAVKFVANKNVEKFQLEKRIKIQSGNFFEDDFPKVDVITMGNILHDWGIEEKKYLIKKTYNSLHQGGALVIIENIIDDNREKNSFGLLMSLNMLIETEKGFDFTANDFLDWTMEAGFKQISKLKLGASSTALIAHK